MLTFDQAVRMALVLAGYKRTQCTSVCFNPDSKEFTAYFGSDTHTSWVHFTEETDENFKAAFKEYDTNLSVRDER